MLLLLLSRAGYAAHGCLLMHRQAWAALTAAAPARPTCGLLACLPPCSKFDLAPLAASAKAGVDSGSATVGDAKGGSGGGGGGGGGRKLDPGGGASKQAAVEAHEHAAAGGGGSVAPHVDLVDVEGATVTSWQYITASPQLLKGPDARQGLKDWVELLAAAHPVERWVGRRL